MLETRQSNWPRICRHTIFLGKPSWCPKQIIEIASIAVTSGGCGRPIWLLAAPVCSKVLGGLCAPDRTRRPRCATSRASGNGRARRQRPQKTRPNGLSATRIPVNPACSSASPRSAWQDTTKRSAAKAWATEAAASPPMHAALATLFER